MAPFKTWRISLKWLFVAFTLLTLFFYLAYIRPTQVASTFIAEIKNRNFQGLKTLRVGDELFKDRLLIQIPTLKTLNEIEVDGSLNRRRWQDVLKCQRNFYLEFGYPPMNQLKVGEYQSRVSLNATAGVLQLHGVAWNFAVYKKGP